MLTLFRPLLPGHRPGFFFTEGGARTGSTGVLFPGQGTRKDRTAVPSILTTPAVAPAPSSVTVFHSADKADNYARQQRARDPPTRPQTERRHAEQRRTSPGSSGGVGTGRAVGQVELSVTGTNSGVGDKAGGRDAGSPGLTQAFRRAMEGQEEPAASAAPLAVQKPNSERQPDSPEGVASARAKNKEKQKQRKQRKKQRKKK